MTVEISIGILTNLLQQFLIVNSADKFDSLITLEMKFFLKLI